VWLTAGSVAPRPPQELSAKLSDATDTSLGFAPAPAWVALQGAGKGADKTLCG